jgi:hypothetical protein
MDPEFAAADQAGKVATKRARDEMERARMAARDQHEADSGVEMVSLGERPRKLLCGVCGDGHDYATIQGLRQHENSVVHKRRLDPALAAAEDAEEVATKRARDEKEKARRRLDAALAAAEDAENAVATKRARDEEKARERDRLTNFWCGVCGDGHDFGTIQNLQLHVKTPEHERAAAEVAAEAAEEAENVASKRAQDETEKARKRDEKEKARMANREQREANQRRDRREGQKQVRANSIQRKFHAKVVAMQKDVPPIGSPGTTEDGEKALGRYHGSTASAMLLNSDEERVKSNNLST